MHAKDDHGVGSISGSSNKNPVYALTSTKNRWVIDWFGLNELGSEPAATPTRASSDAQGISEKNKGANSDSDLVDIYIANYTVAPYNGHLHTIMGAYHPFPSIQMSREVVMSYDRNQLSLDFVFPSQKALDGGVLSCDNDGLGRMTLDVTLPSPQALVVILPGITGGSSEIYVRRMVAALLKRNVALCVVITRGFDDASLFAPQLYSAIFTADIRHVLANYLRPEQVQQRLQCSTPVPIFGIGFSLGGTILSNYVGECGKKGKPSGLDAVISICAPHDLIASSNAMQRLFSRYTYNRILTKRLVAYCERHSEVMQNLYGVDRELLFCGPRPLLHRLCTLSEFDNYVTAPHFGFANAKAYYQAASNFERLLHSKTPQMCVLTADDPITGPPLPRERWATLVRAHKGGIVYVQMPAGGHLGFIGTPREQVSGQPNPMELLVGRSISRFVVHYNKKRASGEKGD